MQDMNYRAAVRMKFIQSLQLLERNKKINWKPEKTKRVYTNESANSETKKEFRELAAHFEFVWYGNHNISTERFMIIDKQFDQFITKET